MSAELEILDLEGLEFEEIERLSNGNSYPFPAVVIGEQDLRFNSKCNEHFKGIEWIEFRTSTEYVVITPVKERSKTAFKVWTTGGNKCATYPINLKEKKIKRGVYKIYKAKDSFAFKRYEPLETF